MSLDKVPLIQYGKAEDIINSVTHAVGAVFGVIVLILCTVRSAKLGSAMGVVQFRNLRCVDDSPIFLLGTLPRLAGRVMQSGLCASLTMR